MRRHHQRCFCTVTINPKISYESIKYFDNLSDYDCAYIIPSFTFADFNSNITSRISALSNAGVSDQEINSDIYFMSNTGYIPQTTKDTNGNTIITGYNYNTGLSVIDQARLKQILLSIGYILPKKISENTFASIFTNPNNQLLTDTSGTANVIDDQCYPNITNKYQYYLLKAYKPDKINKYYVLDTSTAVANPNDPTQFSLNDIFNILNATPNYPAVFNSDPKAVNVPDRIYYYYNGKPCTVGKDGGRYFIIAGSSSALISNYNIYSESDAISSGIGSLSGKGVLVDIIKDSSGNIIDEKWLNTGNSTITDGNDGTSAGITISSSIANSMTVLNITEADANSFNTTFLVADLSIKLPNKIFHETYALLRSPETASLAKAQYDAIMASTNTTLTADQQSIIKNNYSQNGSSGDTNYYLNSSTDTVTKEAVINIFIAMNYITDNGYNKPDGSDYYQYNGTSSGAAVFGELIKAGLTSNLVVEKFSAFMTAENMQQYRTLFRQDRMKML